ncbi:MAG: hypothetical protein WBB37_04600 [bacterium]
MLSLDRIKNNLKWLVKNAGPSVKYPTHRDLLKLKPTSTIMKMLLKEINKDDQVIEVFSKQNS